MRIIKEGQASGEIKAGDPYVLGSLFVGGVLRVAVVKMYGNIKDDLNEYAGFVAVNIWSMLEQRRHEQS